MATLVSELQGIHVKLQSYLKTAKKDAVVGPINRLENSAMAVEKASSGSWFGYHSRVYYNDLQPPPPGAHFSLGAGLQRSILSRTTGAWREYTAEDVENEIQRRAGKPNLRRAREIATEGRGLLEETRGQVLSILEASLSAGKDSYLERLRNEAAECKVVSANDYVSYRRPKGEFISQDSVAVSQGPQCPPHIAVVADIVALRSATTACEKLDKIVQQAGAHMQRTERATKRAERIGTNVFIGHGRSSLWKDLKDFVHDRLRLPYDEFNRVPVAGVTNITRLSEMLDAAAIAFLVMTAEDEQADGKMHARMNVVHEAGLFQGRLGFTKAILLVEEGCEEFGNIHGLGQIRFPAGHITAVFEEIRRVLEREGVLES
jgi:predicted nucleotide-binding protein